MSTLVNKMNREVKVIIPNMREFRTFYSDNEGVIPMFFKRDWEEVKEEHCKPSEEQMDALERTIHLSNFGLEEDRRKALVSLYEQLKKLM